MYSTHYSSQILMKLQFSRQIIEISQVSNSMKIRPVGAELFHAETKADLTVQSELMQFMCGIDICLRRNSIRSVINIMAKTFLPFIVGRSSGRFASTFPTNFITKLLCTKTSQNLLSKTRLHRNKYQVAYQVRRSFLNL
jgi:hypothetical protein